MNFFKSIKQVWEFILEVVFSINQGDWKMSDIVSQIYTIGVRSQSVVMITGAFTGLVLTAQTYFQFHKFGMDTMTLAVNSVAMASELGPVLAALMVTGRVGAAMAAELGTMKVTEQVDALRTLNTHPMDFLVVPRLFATTLAMPALVCEAVAVGILGGYFLAVYVLGIDPVYSWANMVSMTSVSDILTGIIKGFFFGALISFTGCYKGLSCKNGAQGVGIATTDTVVAASIGILMLNFFLTLILSNLLSAL
ncbi:MAG: MlaE family ABC transporter permease [Limisphaerales bacterium]|jgi:phospholipid/cholesterol/gamma-HCH transport system permease protein|nr:ABC transporter permease [Verrucomicrobiota bacterium]